MPLTSERVAQNVAARESIAPKKEAVMASFRSGKALVKMLYNCEHSRRWNDSDLLERTCREVSELKHNHYLKASSMSVLMPDIPLSVFRDIGFLIDMDQCVVRGIFTGDVRAIAIDKEGREVKWNPSQKRYMAMNPATNKFDIRTDFRGRAKVTVNDTSRKVESITELTQHISQQFQIDQSMQNHNEIVVNYPAKSIQGIIVTRNRKPELDGLDDTILEIVPSIKGMVEKQLGVSLPVFMYDCVQGTLEELSR
ncbi:hypothetical protein [Endozoicomonas arenosclerae]|uniref:hypothetical protein n=1 Tax=Endozoicomonas arenosclerae TaxID=1633495 RepID=UPI00078032CE|nr:hypothetical protein [Endozoicomonas arenosclerae]